jgi:hypothetical protein
MDIQKQERPQSIAVAGIGTRWSWQEKKAFLKAQEPRPVQEQDITHRHTTCYVDAAVQTDAEDFRDIYSHQLRGISRSQSFHLPLSSFNTGWQEHPVPIGSFQDIFRGQCYRLGDGLKLP